MTHSCFVFQLKQIAVNSSVLQQPLSSAVRWCSGSSQGSQETFPDTNRGPGDPFQFVKPEFAGFFTDIQKVKSFGTAVVCVVLYEQDGNKVKLAFQDTAEAMPFFPL